MILSIKTADPVTQLRLLKEPDMIKFTNHASARVRYGEAAEQIGSAALRAVNISTDGRFGRRFSLNGYRFNLNMLEVLA